MTGKKYEITTIGQLVTVLSTLPPERAVVMLDELREALTIAATMQGVLTALGLDYDIVQTFTWIDDDKGEKTMTVSVHDEDEVEQFTLDLTTGRAA